MQISVPSNDCHISVVILPNKSRYNPSSCRTLTLKSFLYLSTTLRHSVSIFARLYLKILIFLYNFHLKLFKKYQSFNSSP